LIDPSARVATRAARLPTGSGRRPWDVRGLSARASWLNQVEIYFSVVQRKVLTPNDFADLAAVEARLLASERRYEQTAAPFEWRFTRSDLTKLLERLGDKPDYQAAA
jgi:hypothetical protein